MAGAVRAPFERDLEGDVEVIAKRVGNSPDDIVDEEVVALGDESVVGLDCVKAADGDPIGVPEAGVFEAADVGAVREAADEATGLSEVIHVDERNVELAGDQLSDG